MLHGFEVRERIERCPPFRDHLEQFIVSDERTTVRCEANCVDALACAVTQLEVAEDRAPALTTEAVARWADRICGKVTYLLEPLRTLEIDRRAHSALVRSAEPTRRGDNLCYYEMLVTGDHHVSLRRYSAQPALRRRQAVPFMLTNDQLEKLLDDLLAAGIVN